MLAITENFNKIIVKNGIDVLKNDNAACAQAIKLKYVNDSQPGITRVKKGKGFAYFFKDELVKDGATLGRIKGLVIPPAWQNVWICAWENGHIQVTGFDTLKRKQYRYHPKWAALRGQTKFYSLYEFGKLLPAIRGRVNKDISTPGLSRAKVLATIVSLMERTHIRIGSTLYEKLYGSRGLSTMKDKNVKVEKSQIQFKFVGKKGVAHDINIKSIRLARILENCKEIPGKELFHYYDGEGNVHKVDSGDVNEYIKELSGQEFTSKDFRTWHGTLRCLTAFKEIGGFENVTASKNNIVQALDMVAKKLGNTRAVCKKHYVHPLIISLYENKVLEKYLKKMDDNTANETFEDINPEERILMQILEKESNNGVSADKYKKSRKNYLVRNNRINV